MNNLLTKTSAATNATPTPSRLDKLVGALTDCGELAYFNHISSNFKFQKAGRWSTLETRIRNDIASTDAEKALCTTDTLEKILDLVTIRANHTYSVSLLDAQEATTIRTAMLKINKANISSMEANLYPEKIDFHPGATYVAGMKLCKVADLDDGHAMIFSSVTVSKHLGMFDKYSQAFHTVFVPNDYDRIEFRVSNSEGTRLVKSEVYKLKQEFINEVNLSGNIVSFDSVNVFKAISSLYADANEGRVSYAKMSTFEDAADIICNGKSDSMYCSRSEFTLTQNLCGNDYYPRYMKIRYKYEPNSSEEMELTISPHRNSWESKTCSFFSISEPKNNLSLSLVIANILSRS